jgi:hypothetical protein
VVPGLLLFGKPIQQEVARRAYLELVRARLVTPEAILRAGWDRLVEVLDRGHYVRYDFSTATKLLQLCRELRARHGTLGRLFAEATSEADVRRRLEAFTGVGPTTARIFLRDARPFFHPGMIRTRRPPCSARCSIPRVSGSPRRTRNSWLGEVLRDERKAGGGS